MLPALCILPVRKLIVFTFERRDKKPQREYERGDKRPCAPVHQQQVPQLQISVIAEKRRKLYKERYGGKPNRRKSGYDGKNVGGKEISVVHMRKEKRNTDRKQQRRGENAFFRKTISVYITRNEYGGHIDCRRDYAERGGSRIVFLRKRILKYGIYGRGIVVKSGAYASGLVEIQGYCLEKWAAEQNCGQDEQNIRRRKYGEVPELEFAFHPQHGIDWKNKDRLKLETERKRGKYHGKHGTAIKRAIDTENSQCGIGAVALPPERAVEKNRGEHQNGEKAGDYSTLAFSEAAENECRTVCKQNVKKYAQQLYQIQIVYVRVGKGGKKCALDEIKDLYGFDTAAIVTMEEVVECLYNKECDGKVVIDDTLKEAIDAYYEQYGAK